MHARGRARNRASVRSVPDASAPAISLRGVSKDYGGRPALHELDVDIEARLSLAGITKG